MIAGADAASPGSTHARGAIVAGLMRFEVKGRNAVLCLHACSYAVKSLGITNAPGCAAVAGNDTATCSATFSAGASLSFVSSADLLQSAHLRGSRPAELFLLYVPSHIESQAAARCTASGLQRWRW